MSQSIETPGVSGEQPAAETKLNAVRPGPAEGAERAEEPERHDTPAPAPHGEHPFLQHHFDTPKHQFEAGKLGIWLFLVTEILFFAGLFCAYSVYRSMHPQIFVWAHYYLDTNLGAINTGVLILSSLTAAWAVRSAQLGQRTHLILNVVITIGCAVTFMAIKYVEYSAKFEHGLLWGGRPTAAGTAPKYRFDPHEPVWETHSFATKHPEAASAARKLFAAAHPEGHDRGAATHQRTPVAPPSSGGPPSGSASAAAAAASLPLHAAPSASLGPPAPGGEVALAVADGVALPPGSAAPGSSAAALAPSAAARAPSAAALAPSAAIRSPAANAPPLGPGAASPAPAPATARSSPGDPISLVGSLTQAEALPLLQAGILGPSALDPNVPSRPRNAHIFFGIYFFMTGLHGVHVLAGLLVWVWILTRALRGHFGPKYFGPVDYAALYWHLVDVIWIYLFPLLYLIH